MDILDKFDKYLIEKIITLTKAKTGWRFVSGVTGNKSLEQTFKSKPDAIKAAEDSGFSKKFVKIISWKEYVDDGGIF